MNFSLDLEITFTFPQQIRSRKIKAKARQSHPQRPSLEKDNAKFTRARLNDANHLPLT